ncbi:MAG: PAS domain S-box protein, partial [Candidatus Aminicenantes bacterium]|nr:PAS domain S-box protein [Candidatus Aminicenantes bacterium]
MKARILRPRKALAVKKPPSASRQATCAGGESSPDLHAVLRHLVAGYYRCTMDGVLLDHNPSFNRILGFPPDEDKRGTKLPDFWWNPDDRKAFLDELVGSGTVANFKIRAKTAAGAEIIILANSRLLRDESGRPAGIEGTFTDITSLERAEDALRISEAKFVKAFRSSPDAILITSLSEGRIVEANDALSRLTGYAPEELTGRTTPELSLWADDSARDEYVSRLGQDGRVTGLEAKFRVKSGAILDGLVSGEIIDLPEGPHALSVVRDITERKRMEADLANSVSLLRATLESTADGILVVDREGRIAGYNRRFTLMWGIPEEIMSGGSDDAALEFVLGQLKEPGAFLNKVKELYARAEEESFDTLEFKDGRVFERYSRPQRTESGVIGRVWSFRDATERLRTEEALRKSERRFRELYENATIGLYQTTPDGRVTLANRSLVRMLGFDSFEELAARNLEEDGYHPRYPRREFRERLEREGEVTGLESAWRRKDGSTIFVRESARLVRDAAGSPLYYEGTVEDVTERKKAEEALGESEAYYRTLVETSPD